MPLLMTGAYWEVEMTVKFLYFSFLESDSLMEILSIRHCFSLADQWVNRICELSTVFDCSETYFGIISVLRLFLEINFIASSLKCNI